MARKHYWQFLVTDEGNPIENAKITVYIAGTNEVAWVYTAEQGTEGSETSPQITTSLKGYFEFWISDLEDAEHGRDISTKFKIGWVANGVSDGFIDNIDIFSTFINPVDETDSSSELKNKSLSNFLAWTWEDHRMSALPDRNPHGIFPVEIQGTVESPEDGERNKVFSNYLGRMLDDHARYQWDGSRDTSGESNPYTVLPDRVHGILQVDETDATLNTDKNKLISNELAKLWTDHANNVPLDPHPQYMMVAGDDGVNGENFTGLVGYSNSTIVNSADDDDFITKAWVEARGYRTTITSWGGGLGNYSATITLPVGMSMPHAPVITCYSGAKVIQPIEVEYFSSTQIKITMYSAIDVFVVMVW
jgi:hypothetical protein